MRSLLVAVVLFSAPVFADILPDDVAVCQGKTAGQKCVTDDGMEGTCVERVVTRPDYSGGIPPTYKQVKMLGCVAPGRATRAIAPWVVGIGLAFLAFLMAMLMRRGGPSSPAQAV